MAAAQEGSLTAGFVGRILELEAVQAVLDAASEGRGSALLVTGDAGVGKTRLVAEACGRAGDDMLVLSGACLPLTSLTLPLLPLRAAVRRLPAAQRPGLLTSGSRGEDTAAEAAMEFDVWLDRLSSEQAVALVVDDLHWADQATLDVLMWVLAGVTDRSLAVLTTVRSGEVVTSHPLQRWLADLRRLPGFAHLPLGPLDLDETRQQLSELMGDEPHDSLVRDVFTRTGGNAYLNRLLVEGVAAAATSLGPALPDDLVSAVLRAWHRLDPPARELARVIAVGGQVARAGALDRAADLAGVTDLRRALRHCVDGGVLEEDGDGGYWFHHPLQAEALEGSLEQQERQRLHAAYAGALEGDLSRSTAATGTPDLETLVLIADHHHRAGHTQESYLWSLRAADRAHVAGSDAEQVRLLRRALEVRERLDDSAAEPASALWERVRHAAETLGDHEEELAAVDALLAALDQDQDQDPLECAELLVRRQHLRFSTGKGFLDADELRRAVALAGREPESWQQAFALAELAHASLWQDDPRATQLAALSLEGARDCGHPRALAHALAANAMLAVFEGRVEEGRVLGAEAVAAAAQARDGWAFVHATLWEANAVGTPVSPTWAAVVSGRRAQLMSLALPQPFIAWLASDEGGARLYAGEWDACAQLLRTALGAKPGVLVDVKTRLNAARMAALQGRSREAEGHLARADELFAETSTFLALEFDTVRALVRLCAGDLRGTVDAALAGTATAGVPPTMCEWLLPLAARALADLGQGERDGGRDPGPVVAELDDLFRRFPRVIADMGGATDFYARELAGLQSLYEAEVARGRQSADAGARWADATRALHGVLPWEECYALWRQAEALLMGGLVGGSRQREPGVEALRRSHALARGLRAQPVLDELVSLARGARISLADPATTGPAPAARARAGLTARETEVLHHVVAGRSYGEIARALVVSEKTVSSHVSNLLRKTGCANRVDLARWATHPPAEHEA